MIVKRIHLGSRILQLLEEKRMSKAEFGRRIGIPAQNVNRLLEKESVETGKLIEVCEALEYNLFKDFVPTTDAVSIVATNGSNISGNTTLGNGATSSTINNYGETCANGEPSPIVATLTESIATLTRELETSQEQKSRLIGIIEQLTNK